MWNPNQYGQFHEERSLPFFDLLSLVERKRPLLRVVDLGCGTGELTRRLHHDLRATDTLGIDSSVEMLSKAAAGGVPVLSRPGSGEAAPSVPNEGLHFEHADIATFTSSIPFDLVFSNAALHWLPDHPALFARLTSLVAADGGQLAVQMPLNFDHPSHATADEIGQEEPFKTGLGGWRREWPLLLPEEYARLLDHLGYRARLDAPTYERFVARYREVLLPRLEDTKPYLYPFKRILLWGAR